MRIVLDTNVLIASLISRGKCYALVEHFLKVHEITYGSLIFERGEEIGLKLEDEQRCKRKDRKSRRYTTAICRTEANGSPRATRQIFSSTWE